MKTLNNRLKHMKVAGNPKIKISKQKNFDYSDKKSMKRKMRVEKKEDK